MIPNYDFASGAAVVQHWSRAYTEDCGQRPRLLRAFSPSAKDEAADRESDKWPAHVDQD
jgi:hypothetical protein